MISLEPSSRLSFSTLLSQYRQTAFPEIFYTFLHPFLNSLNRISSPTSLSTTANSQAPAGTTTRLGNTSTTTISGGAVEVQQQTLLRTESDDRIERIWNEWEIVQRYLDESLEVRDPERGENGGKTKSREPGEGEVDDIFPIKLNLPGMEGRTVEGGCAQGEPFDHSVLRQTKDTTDQRIVTVLCQTVLP